MKNKILKVCTYISMAFFLGLISLWVYLSIFGSNPGSGWSPMNWGHIPLGYDIKLTASRFDDSRVHEWLIFFNGPYPNDTTMLGPTDTITGYEGYGIYYHVIHESATKVAWWTLMISLWYPIILFAILPAIFVVKKIAQSETSFNQRDTC